MVLLVLCVFLFPVYFVLNIFMFSFRAWSGSPSRLRARSEPRRSAAYYYYHIITITITIIIIINKYYSSCYYY